MKKLSQLLESINEIDSLLELDFKDKKAFQKYQSIHKMKPTTKVNIAGKDTTVGDETGDDSQTPPAAPKKMTGKDVDNKAVANAKAQDDIEKDIMGDEPKGDTTADTLTKGLKDGGLNPYKDGPMINQALDDIGGDHSDLKKRIDTYGDNVPSSRGKSEAQYQKEIDKYKEEGEKLSNDIVDAISDKDEPEDYTKGIETADAVDAALERFNDEVDLDSFEDNPDSFDALMDIADDLNDTPIGDDEEFRQLFDDLSEYQDTESAENLKQYLDGQLTVDKPTKDSKGRILPQAPNYDTEKKTTSKKPSSLDSYYAKEAAKEKWLASNPGKTAYDWKNIGYGTMSDLIDKEMKARGFKENINLKELSKIKTRYNR